jgi:hypothetical protein
MHVVRRRDAVGEESHRRRKIWRSGSGWASRGIAARGLYARFARTRQSAAALKRLRVEAGDPSFSGRFGRQIQRNGLASLRLRAATSGVDRPCGPVARRDR